MIYQQCGLLYPQACNTGVVMEYGGGGCVEGCFCPIGQFAVHGYCLKNYSDCEGTVHI